LEVLFDGGEGEDEREGPPGLWLESSWRSWIRFDERGKLHSLAPLKAAGYDIYAFNRGLMTILWG